MTLAITYPATDGEPADLLEVTEITDPPPPGPWRPTLTTAATPTAARSQTGPGSHCRWLKRWPT
jgi:hypothetical protein